MKFSGVLLVVAVLAVAAGERSARAEKPTGTTKVCTTKKVGKREKRVCKRVAIFSGHNASRDSLRVEPLEKPSGEIALRAEHLDEQLAVDIYRPDGSFDETALAQLDEIFRCKRSLEVRAVDPRLYEMLSRIYDHFGKQEIELVSGFRFRERDSSRHYHASAMDIRIKGVSIRELRDFAESLDEGGMGIGIYPTSGFIHVDFRAPGEPSYRWTDLSGPDSDNGRPKKSTKKSDKKSDKSDKNKKDPRGRTKPARKPTS